MKNIVKIADMTVTVVVLYERIRWQAGEIKCCGNCSMRKKRKKQQIMKIYLMEHKNNE